ncbi:uncharacterized protein LOC133884156 [Phragmites australis]|uniref:uncharacterized protein LOC133884156 n=1 Tax=Phragmites australis TaxID=29695 RepID=UPI002D766B1D|nr:uncharacterized protein LOC133884156 [Phragmites australis]
MVSSVAFADLRALRDSPAAALRPTPIATPQGCLAADALQAQAIQVAMVTQKPIYSFFKRKRDEPTEQPSVSSVLAPLTELECQRQDEEQPADEPVVFRGIELLERDPSKLPQIWEYTCNQHDEVRQAYLKLGSMQPKLKNISLQDHKGISVIFSAIGSVNFHAVKECHTLLNRPNHIENIMEVISDREKERNRLWLKTSIATVKWLTLQSRTFRGHDETPESKNRGNFVEMIKLLAEFNPEIASVVLENAPLNAKYTSPDIQNEILSIFAIKVRKHIREEIGDAKFSILVDETCDIAKREQMALVFRFVDEDGVLQERLFDLIHVRNTKALTLKEELCHVLSSYSFDVQNLRDQGYDDASNMKGELNGLQALFLRECPYSYYVHCYTLRLQLALVAASREVVGVSQFFQKLLFIVNTVDSSSKRHDELHDAQMVELARLLATDELETSQGANQIRSLKRPGETRWGSHLGSISTLMDMFNL